MILVLSLPLLWDAGNEAATFTFYSSLLQLRFCFTNRMLGGLFVSCRHPRRRGRRVWSIPATVAINFSKSWRRRLGRGKPFIFFNVQFMCWSKFRATISVHVNGR